jgi:two-component system, NtrC family, response regulator GlrR
MTTTSKARILVVDDDPSLLRVVSMRLDKEGYQVSTAESAQKALAQLDASGAHLVLTDLRMAGMDGLALFEAVARRYPGLPVVIMTAHGTVSNAVAALRRGVFGYLTKPFEAQALVAEVERALGSGGPTGATSGDDGWRDQIVTRSPLIQTILGETARVAVTDASVMITGETGTGKELLARAIHRANRRATAPFVAVNCAAIPEQLLESELFGHRKGSFTGATGDHIGLIQSAQGGTLFLDEIGDMPLPLQAKLLRVLQEREVRPIGSTRSLPVDVRIISATHRDLAALITEQRFREDLYYRLKVVTFELPPLDSRREDIPLLAQRFLADISERYKKRVTAFAPDGLELLVNASWPRNIRQLYNVVETAVALATAAIVPSSLVERALRPGKAELESLDDAKRGFEREYLVNLLKQTQGNVTQAARLPRRNRSEFYSLLHRHDLDPALFKTPRE